MAREQDGEQVTAEDADPGSGELLAGVPLPRDPGQSESLTTVIVAFTANVLIAVAKTAAAVLTGSASLVAEACPTRSDRS